MLRDSESAVACRRNVKNDYDVVAVGIEFAIMVLDVA